MCTERHRSETGFGSEGAVSSIVICRRYCAGGYAELLGLNTMPRDLPPRRSFWNFLGRRSSTLPDHGDAQNHIGVPEPERGARDRWVLGGGVSYLEA